MACGPRRRAVRLRLNIAEGKGLTDECVITLVDAGVTFMVLSVSSNSECRRVSTALVLGSD